MAKGVFLAVFFPSMGVEMSCCFVAFLCLVMGALRIAGPPWDTIRWTDWDGTVLWACFPPQGVAHFIILTSQGSDMNQECNISLMNDLLFTCHPLFLLPSHISCLRCLCPYFYLLLFIAVLPSFSSWNMAGPLIVSFPSPLNQMSWLYQLLFQGLEKTTSKMVSLNNVFYLSTIKNVAIKDVTNVVPYIQSHLVAALFKLDTQSLWHAEP